MTRRSRTGDAETGNAVALAGVGLALAGLLVVVAVDVGAYLLAASRAQAVADAAALAAATAVHEGTSPWAAAQAVVQAADGDLVECGCRRLPVVVRVATPVDGLVVPALTARTVTATARATMVDP